MVKIRCKKDKIANMRKAYREANKDKLKSKRRLYYINVEKPKLYPQSNTQEQPQRVKSEYSSSYTEGAK